MSWWRWRNTKNANVSVPNLTAPKERNSTVKHVNVCVHILMKRNAIIEELNESPSCGTHPTVYVCVTFMWNVQQGLKWMKLHANVFRTRMTTVVNNPQSKMKKINNMLRNKNYGTASPFPWYRLHLTSFITPFSSSVVRKRTEVEEANVWDEE